MSSFSWRTVIQKAWQSPQKNIAFYWWSLPTAFLGLVATSQIENLDWQKSLFFFASSLAVLFFFYLAQAILKMGLLSQIIQQEKERASTSENYSVQKFLSLTRQTLRIELFILGLSFLFLFILSLPLIIATLYNTAALKILWLIVFIVTLPLVSLLVLFRELLYLYSSLATIPRIPVALEATLTLLRKRGTLLLQLFFLAFSSLFLFTILLNVAMLTSAPFWEKYLSFSLGNFTQHLFLVFLQAWFLIFWQALWYYGFQMIAKLPESKIDTVPEGDEVPVVISP